MNVEISNKILFMSVSVEVYCGLDALDAWLPMDGVLVSDWILEALF